MSANHRKDHSDVRHHVSSVVLQRTDYVPMHGTARERVLET